MIRNVFAILSLVLAGSIFYFYTRPTYDSVQATKTKIAEYDVQLSQVAQMQKSVDELNARYSALNQNDVARLQKLLPDHVDNIALILDLDKMASSYGMPLQNVDVNKSSTPVASDTIGEASAQKFDSLTLKFATKGTYDSFKKLLSDLEQSLRVVDLVALKLDNTGEFLGSAPVYHYDISIRTYWLK